MILAQTQVLIVDLTPIVVVLIQVEDLVLDEPLVEVEVLFLEEVVDEPYLVDDDEVPCHEDEEVHEVHHDSELVYMICLTLWLQFIL